MGQLCCFPFSRDEEKIIFWQLISINRSRQGNKHKDTIMQAALHRELKAVSDLLTQIKNTLALPETKANIYKEIYGMWNGT
ncbi:uncharacterized protein LOC134587103 isoform X2 [Pelobates fuscus]|uniref:uncharacterized protein LOC134587103 isoform X2 n=1 Tax=Pelobates fuscus TaxID=191477 RepID=UPI002FE4E951